MTLYPLEVIYMLFMLKISTILRLGVIRVVDFVSSVYYHGLHMPCEPDFRWCEYSENHSMTIWTQLCCAYKIMGLSSIISSI